MAVKAVNAKAIERTVRSIPVSSAHDDRYRIEDVVMITRRVEQRLRHLRLTRFVARTGEDADFSLSRLELCAPGTKSEPAVVLPELCRAPGGSSVGRDVDL